MATQIRTIEGLVSVSEQDRDYMEYLDELYETNPSFGLLLFKADPIAFRLGKQDWEDNR